jgi:hypothetical protein
MSQFYDKNYYDLHTIRGIVIFVYVDCVTLEPLPDDKQDPAYKQPGVKLPRGTDVMNAYKYFWKRSMSEANALGEAAVWDEKGVRCGTGYLAKREDCVQAVGALLDGAASQVKGNAHSDTMAHQLVVNHLLHCS